MRTIQRYLTTEGLRMAKRTVEVVECDRCHRKEERPPQPEGQDQPQDQLEITYRPSTGEPVVVMRFPDLCERCQKSVGGMVDRISGVKKES